MKVQGKCLLNGDYSLSSDLHAILVWRNNATELLHMYTQCSVFDVICIVMKNITNYYQFKLKECLAEKQKVNPNYSLRAFSRDLGIHPSTMSKVIKGERPLPLKDSTAVIEKLSLTPKERTMFMDSLIHRNSKLDKIKINYKNKEFLIDESYHKVISQWEHLAVLELFDTNDFKCADKVIAHKLDLTLNRAQVVISNLLACSLLKNDQEKGLIRTFEAVRTTEDITNIAIQKSHKETLEMGIEKLEKIEVAFRDFSATTVAIDLKMLPEAKAIIREFRKKMTELLRNGDQTEVYKLAIQFFPLTNLNTKEYIQ